MGLTNLVDRHAGKLVTLGLVGIGGVFFNIYYNANKVLNLATPYNSIPEVVELTKIREEIDNLDSRLQKRISMEEAADLFANEAKRDEYEILKKNKQSLERQLAEKAENPIIKNSTEDLNVQVGRCYQNIIYTLYSAVPIMFLSAIGASGFANRKSRQPKRTYVTAIKSDL